MSKCGAVGCEDTLTDGAKCSICMKDFHFQCAGVTEAGYRKLGDRKSTWRCPTCKQVKSSLTPASPAGGDVMSLLHDINSKLAPLDQIISDMQELKNGFAELKTAVSTTNKSMAEFSKKITEMEARLCQVEGTRTDVIALQHKIEKLEVELNVRDQWSRMSNVEIKGIPLTKNENLYDIVASIGSKIGYPIIGDQINYIARMPTRDPERIKPIVVCFNNRYRKENFIAAARKSFGPGKLTCTQLGFPGNHKIYVNDHLTPYNKALLAKAKTLKNERDFTYIWVKHCKIMVRKNESSPAISIKSEKDLTKII